AATTLDTSMRLQRFILAEIGAEYRLPALQNANLATVVTFVSCAALAFLADPANPGGGGMVLWPLFGTTNQLTAGLSLLVLTLLLRQLGRNYLLTLVPFVFVATITAWSMCLNVLGFVATGNGLLVVIGVLILILNLWLLAEGLIALRQQPAAPVRG
ncbi:MAG TPA: carbon starvation CstA 5TM domain-containing protein, partial [Gammaproteobacteria bacterium]|nr:carbon starvation CstA 5TM domain-containing protein [Gammaproteobacteria bacterium]